jgi:serine/threonine protein kinase/Flp pilus assembly protein TadD
MTGTSREEFKGLYSDITEIGSGGGGVIFKAYHQRLQKYVVLKKMRTQVHGILDERMETDILKNLHHEYLPQVFDFLKIENDVYTVMDFVDGKSFEQLIKEKVLFSNKQILKYTRQLCEVMAYLHKQKPPVLHGDIKPANIMLKPDDNICLIDFNIAGFLSEGTMVTVGYSEGYASPEQCQAVQSLENSAFYTKQSVRTSEEKTILQQTPMSAKNDATEALTVMSDYLKEYKTTSPVKQRESITLDNSVIKIDLRADVYSIGATMYHLATGVRPSTEPEKNLPIENIAEGYSNGFSVIINKAMEAEPDRRFANAGEMLQALEKIHKYDRKYKILIIKQEIAYFAMVLFIGASVLMFFLGEQRMKVEQLEEYDAIITELTIARENDSAQFESLYEKACTLMPEKLDAHYQKAVYLTEQCRYEENILFIQENLLNQTSLSGQDFADDTYYLIANCYFELEEYKEAVVYYQAAVERNGQVSQYYGDYAISLVYCGRIDNAEEVLRQGRERGMGSDYVLLVSAEIESAKGKYDEAIAHFKECIDSTTNQTMKLRAYILCDKTFRKKGDTEEILQESTELLIKATTDVELGDQLLVFERLAQDYIDLASITGNEQYDENALAVLEEIIKHGWDNDTTHMNKAILLQKSGRLREAEAVLNELIGKDADNYIYYKRLAVLEADIQGTIPNEERDYRQFAKYYNTTMDMYKKTKLETNDVEIQWLQQMYEQLISGGWLEG